MTDEEFLGELTARLAALPQVEAVTLGGSRAWGTARPDSDWDLGIYYRGAFDPATLRELGYPGKVSEIGDWGGGVFNGGAWLRIDGRAVDVHYRDLDAVEYELVEARAGRVRIEALTFHLGGIPNYLVVGELARNRVLSGRLPRPRYPEKLRREAPVVWWSVAQLHLGYARTSHAAAGRAAQCLAMLTVAATQTAQAGARRARRMDDQ